MGTRDQSYFDHLLLPRGPGPDGGVQAHGEVEVARMDPTVMELTRRGLLPQYRPGLPFPMPLPSDVQVLLQMKGKGKGKGKDKGQGQGMIEGNSRL